MVGCFIIQGTRKRPYQFRVIILPYYNLIIRVMIFTISLSKFLGYNEGYKNEILKIIKVFLNCSRTSLQSGKFDIFSIILATWHFGKSPLPIVAFRDLLADPLPPPN